MKRSSHRIEARQAHRGIYAPKRTDIEETPKPVQRYKKADSTPAELTGEAKRRFDDMFRRWKNDNQ